jgi:hypothetical protein
MKKLYFDECGFTGNNLLDEDTPFFIYLGIESNEDFENKFKELKQKYNYPQKETKGNRLCKSSTGQKLINDLWNYVKNNIKYVVHNKKYALAAKIFEYTYEPIFSEYNSILYHIDFHRFFSSLIYYSFVLKDKTAEFFFNSFKEYIMNKKHDGFLISLDNLQTENPFLYNFYKFCELHRQEIIYDIDDSLSTEKWLLDLTMASLNSILGSFAGDSSEELFVICDESKPLKVNIELMNAFIGDTRTIYINLLNNRSRINYNLKEEIKLCKSDEHISLQIADVLVSSISYAIKHKDNIFYKNLLQNTENCFLSKSSTFPISVQYDEYELEIYYKIMHELSEEKSKIEIIENVKNLGSELIFYHHYIKHDSSFK